VGGGAFGRKKSSKSIGLKWLGARVERQSHAERFLASFRHGRCMREAKKVRRVMRAKVRQIKALIQAAYPRTLY